MKCLRIYATPDGESHFGDADIPTTTAPLFPNEAPFRLSGHYPASPIRFVHVPAGVREAGGTPHRGEYLQYGLTASWNLRRATERCAVCRRGVRF